MPKILILYCSRTGNAEKMVKAVADGAKTVQGAEVETNYYIQPEQLDNYDAILIGIPTIDRYHHDMPVSIKNLLEEAAVKNVNLKGKIGATFGSYGWSGEAPKLIIEIMKNKFEMNVTESPLLIKYAADKNALDECIELGKRMPKALCAELHGSRKGGKEPEFKK